MSDAERARISNKVAELIGRLASAVECNGEPVRREMTAVSRFRAVQKALS